jgi:hypothetical protein
MATSAASEINMSAFDHASYRRRRLPLSFVRPMKGECLMTNFRLIEAAALSLLLAAPVMAMHRGNHHRYVHFSQRAYRAYASDRGNDFVPENYSNDFNRRNTFN